MDMSNKRQGLWTAESVTEGHPDKVADAISDAILDEFLKCDRECHVAAETFLPSGQLVVIGGEIQIPDTIKLRVGDLNYVQIARSVAERIGYTKAEEGFDSAHCIVLCNLKGQSYDISRGVLRQEHEDQGAGDQGMMFGYACNETEELMPSPIMMAHKLVKRLAMVRRSGHIPGLRPDGKSQITLSYSNSLPTAASKIVLAAQHDPTWNDKMGELKELLRCHVVEPSIPAHLLESFDWENQFIVNGTGQFEVGGPMGDAGLTGRKIIVDTYGGMVPHGGGAFSGKDPSKVDRSANYYARYVAKNVVAAGLASRCLIRVAYAIGKPEPFGLDIDTFGTEMVSPENITKAIVATFDFRPTMMIDQLQLKRPIYSAFSAYGHFGRIDVEGTTWENCDRVAKLRKEAGA